MRNPRWHKNEIILALYLYFDPDRGSIASSNQKIIELSESLNKLKLPIERKDEEKFRNPNGVTIKLSNFLAIDPSYSGVGMTSYSKLDKELFFEFVNKKSELKKEALQILKGVKK